jgi:hypothetical protein
MGLDAREAATYLDAFRKSECGVFVYNAVGAVSSWLIKAAQTGLIEPVENWETKQCGDDIRFYKFTVMGVTEAGKLSNRAA